MKARKRVEKIRRTVGKAITDKPGKLAAAAGGVAAAAAIGVGAYRAARHRGVTDGAVAYHVRPGDTEGWVLQADGDANRSFGRKHEAVAAGRKAAREHPPSVLVVHKTDGKVGRTYQYSADAR